MHFCVEKESSGSASTKQTNSLDDVRRVLWSLKMADVSSRELEKEKSASSLERMANLLIEEKCIFYKGSSCEK